MHFRAVAIAATFGTKCSLTSLERMLHVVFKSNLGQPAPDWVKGLGDISIEKKPTSVEYGVLLAAMVGKLRKPQYNSAEWQVAPGELVLGDSTLLAAP